MEPFKYEKDRVMPLTGKLMKPGVVAVLPNRFQYATLICTALWEIVVIRN